MTLHRSTFAKMQLNGDSFCGIDGFDEYNWDWTLIHKQNKSKELIPHTDLVPSEPLAKHIGIEGRMHSHRKGATAKEELKKLETRFLGTKLKGIPIVSPLRSKGNGSWGAPS
jgi:hypothetical protein